MRHQPTQDDVYAVEEAQQQILEAIETLRQVARSTDDEWARRYIIAHLETVTTSDHGWLSRDQNIDDWLKKLRQEAGGPIKCHYCDLIGEYDEDGTVYCPECEKEL